MLQKRSSGACVRHLDYVCIPSVSYVTKSPLLFSVAKGGRVVDPEGGRKGNTILLFTLFLKSSLLLLCYLYRHHYYNATSVKSSHPPYSVFPGS